MIKQAIAHIEEQTGLKIKECGYFSGLETYRDEKYFNIETEKPVWQSVEYTKLERLCYVSELISRIEPNGHTRVAIFLK